ncbi:hypothetical protein [Flavobacterium sp.]|uniref:hypothetical protein n=2 Tax=unclassified Flavobacterium TaxID=196869 RepID=UPI0031E3E638
MRKNNLILMMISIILISCGSKNDNNELKEKNEEIQKTQIVVNTDCQCSELNLEKNLLNGIPRKLKDIQKKDSNKPYTGTCIEKDQNDSIIRKVEIKNGWVNREIIRKKIEKNKSYITISDFTFEDATKTNGWKIDINELREKDESISSYYVYSFEEIKNKNIYNRWSISLENRDLSYNPSGEIKYGVYNIVFSPEIQNGQDKNWKPNCMSTADSYSPNPGHSPWEMKKLSFEQFSKTMNELKKEVPHFNYWN